MSGNPVTKLSELDEARYRVIRLLMQSEDVEYLSRLELQLSNVLDPERLAKEEKGEVEPAASIVLPKPLVEMSREERSAYRVLQRPKQPPLTKPEMVELAKTYEELSEDEFEEMMND